MNTYQQRQQEQYEIRNRDVLAMIHDELHGEPEPVELDGMEAAIWQALHKHDDYLQQAATIKKKPKTPEPSSLAHQDTALRAALRDALDAGDDDTLRDKLQAALYADAKPTPGMDALSRSLMKALAHQDQKGKNL